MYPVITKEIQKKYEGSKSLGSIPEICGVLGRACRRMEDPEGANRMLCNGCSLAEYAKQNKR